MRLVPHRQVLPHILIKWGNWGARSLLTPTHGPVFSLTQPGTRFLAGWEAGGGIHAHPLRVERRAKGLWGSLCRTGGRENLEEESAYGRLFGSGVSDHETLVLPRLCIWLRQHGELLRRGPDNCLKKLKATSLQHCPSAGSVRRLSKGQALPRISQNEDEAFPHLQSSEDGHSNKKPRDWEVSQLERGSLYRHMDLIMDP